MMRRVVERHLKRLQRAREAPEELVRAAAESFERLYPSAAARLRPARQQRIPMSAPDWYFELELRRSGLWAMMERCYPSPLAQSQ